MVRNTVVIALAVLVIGLTLPNVLLPSPVSASIPLSVNDHYDIVSITPRSFADSAGLRVGDHLQPQSLSVVGRLAMQDWYALRMGESLKFTVDRAGRAFPVTLREPQGGGRATGVAIVKRTSATIFIVVAAVLLLLRPSTMLWGLFLYALGSGNGESDILEWYSPQAVALANTFLVSVVYGILGPLGLLMFAARFPAKSASGWRHIVEKLTPALATLLAVPSAAFVLFVLGVPLPVGTDFVTNGITTAIVTIAIITLLAGFAQVDPRQRQRLRWVVAGFAIFYLPLLYVPLSAYLPGQGWPASWTNAGWSSDVLIGLGIFIPITVAYAVLKHHVLDLNFVIGRGLVYGILTSIAVATFAIIEWFIGGVLAQTKLAAAGEVVAAVAIGFWLNGLHSRVDGFVDTFLFRRRHIAERRLARVATGLPHADRYETITTMLLSEPIESLGLLSAAFFRRSEDGEFRCESAIGLHPSSDALIDIGDRLAVHLQGERGAIFLDGISRRMRGVIDGASAPVVACPIFVRHELRAIVLYGGHETGEAFLPDEIRLLEALCIGASAALDHLDSATMERRLSEAERKVTTLTEALELLRVSAAPTGS